MRDNDALDRMIDRAVGSYGSATDGDELEARVLRGVQRRIAVEERTASHRRWLHWAGALAAAACLAFLWVNHARPVKPHDGDAQREHQQLPGSAVAGGVAPGSGGRGQPMTARRPSVVEVHVHRERARQRPVQTAPLPKLDVFPAPHSLTEEEAALSFFIRRAQPREVQDLLSTRAQAEAPLVIKELEIPPIGPPLDGGK